MITNKEVITPKWTTRQMTNINGDIVYDAICTNTGKLITSFNANLTADRKLFYSNDNGKTWSELTQTFNSSYITKLVNNRILLTTGEVYYSDDNGETWTKATGAFNVYGVRIHVLKSGRLLLPQPNSKNAIYTSSDNGETWSVINPGINKNISSIIELSTGRLLIGTWSGIWYSDDGCETCISSAQTAGNIMHFCVTPTGRVLAASKTGYILYSDDNGETWTQSNIIAAPTNIRYTNIISIDSNKYIAGSTKGIWYSNDNGETWTISVDSVDIKSIYLTPTERVIAVGNNSTGGILMYYDLVQEQYSSKPLTGAQAKQLVAECKAYVQRLKQS